MLYTTDAIVLRRADYRDYDRMVTLFSPDRGRIDAIARGCRRPRSALMASSEVFCAGEYTLNVTGERHSIVQCAVKDSFYELRYDYERLTHATYCLSLADAAALPDQGAPEIFMLLLKALAHFNYSGISAPLLTAAFEMRFMPLMGYTPRMERCVVCGREPDARDVRFDEEKGGVACGSCCPEAPAISNGARRIIWRAAATDDALVPKLEGHPDWPEAARLYRPFVLRRIERRIRSVIPETAPSGG